MIRSFHFGLVAMISVLNVQAQSLTKDFPETVRIKIVNPTSQPRNNVLILVRESDLQKQRDFNARNFIVLDNGNEIASQYVDNHRDVKGVAFVLDELKPDESREVMIRYNKKGFSNHQYPKRTQAELSHKVNGQWKNREYIGGQFKNVNYLRVPPEHKDHSWFIRYEGPGWESDKVGYRFYLDQRNATDVFGKKVPDIVLQNAGQDGFDSYHEMQDWGMDVMKVGKSLGVGSIGILHQKKAVRIEKTDSVTCEITENGVLFSAIETNYYGWTLGEMKTNLRSQISIHAGSRLTHQRISLTGNPENICTGIVKDPAAKLLINKGSRDGWGYIATFGKQSLNSDNLGLAVFFKAKDLIEISEDEFSHIIALKPDQRKLEYFFLGAWEKEQDGIQSEDEFLQYLDRTVNELGQPAQVEVALKK